MSKESTTPDLVERARRLGEAINRRDFDAVERCYAPDAVWRGERLGLIEGAAAIRGALEVGVRSYEEFKAELEEITDLGNGVTFAVLILKGRLIGSAGELEMRYAAIAIWTEGLVECEMGYPDIDQGRAAAERLAEERE